jgi:hypothetical protein
MKRILLYLLSAASLNAVTLTTSDDVDAIMGAANYAAIRALLDLEPTTDFLSPDALAAAYQPLNTDLTDLADGSLTGTKVGVADIGGYYTASDIEAALQEIGASIEALGTGFDVAGNYTLTGAWDFSGGSVILPTIDSLVADEATIGNVLLSEGAAPATPAASNVTFYAKSDGYIYGKDDAGTETPLSNSLQTDAFIIAISDETTAHTTGTAKVTFRAPYAFTITGVKGSLTTVSSSGIPTWDINETGTTILSTKLTIDASEKTSTTAATAVVISDTAIAADAEITIDIDTAGTGAAGGKVTIIHTH